MPELIRTDASHPDFISLVSHLDRYLEIMDGNEHPFYAQYNKITFIRHVVVAYVDDQPAGCGAIKAFDDDCMELKRMFTEPALRQQGVATAILKDLESWAAELGYKKCILETGKRQTEAINLYLKNQYQPMPNYGQYTGVENSLCFEKLLK